VLSRHPLVKKTEVNVIQNTTTLWTLQPEDLLAEDPSLSNLNVNRAGLEDAFLALTRKAETNDTQSGATA
jgi:hypothetical protein